MIVIIILRFTSFSSCTVEPSLFEDERRRSLKAAKRGFANSKGVSSKKGGCLIFWMSWVQNTKWSKGSDIPRLQLLSVLFSFQHPPLQLLSILFSIQHPPLQFLSILFSIQHPLSNSFLFYSPFKIPPPTTFYFILLSTSPSNSFLFYSPFNIRPSNSFLFYSLFVCHFLKFFADSLVNNYLETSCSNIINPPF